jgi:phenylacetate-CoA ligase
MLDFYSLFIRSAVLPAVSLLTKSDFWRIYRQFQKNPSLLYDPSPDDLWRKLQGVIAHAYEHVPFYRERMDTLGVVPSSLKGFEDFRQLPPTTKADITANFPDRISSTDKRFEPWRYVSTSGTTGRMTLIHDFRKRDFGRAMLFFALHCATGYQPGMKYLDIPPDICANVCGVSGHNDEKFLPFVFKKIGQGRIFEGETVSALRGLVDRRLVQRQMQLTSFGAGGLRQKSQALDDYLQRIASYRPYHVRGLSAYLYVLALHILEHKKTPPPIPGGLTPMGSSMTPRMRRVVEEAFRCRVHETYGSAEMASIAAECGRQNGLHPFQGLFYVEVIRQGKPAGNGETGRVLLTDLINYAMPLLRYDIGDAAVVREGRCPCGIAGPRIDVQGRIQDCLPGEDGLVITPDQMMDWVLGAFPDVLVFQLEKQSPQDYYLQVMPKKEKVPNLEEIVALVSRRLPGKPRVRARVVATILPEPGGKYRFIKNRINDAAPLF